jgi:murein tripeptide amidase MpaA
VFVFPCVNPDGREFSQKYDPLWRRNRNPADSGGQPGCVGVDLNRNFDFLWDFVNLFAPEALLMTSADPCAGGSQGCYRGRYATSEPETRNVVWLLDTFPRIRWLIDLHSFGELIMYPWGDDQDQTADPSMNFTNPTYNSVRGIGDDSTYKEYIPPDDLVIFQSKCNRVKDAIQAVRGKDYTVQQSYSLYPTSQGCSVLKNFAGKTTYGNLKNSNYP